MIALLPLRKAGIAHAQSVVATEHYLRRPVDPRCSVEGYVIKADAGLGGLYIDAGYLLFGRPEATKVRGWYGTLDALAAGRVACSYWQVLNLARVWLDPSVQPGGALYSPEHLPGFVDRRGAWRSTLASSAIRMAAHQVRVDYLVRRPPCFLEEPYQLQFLISYCDTRLHRGVIYRAAGFELYRTNARGIQTWRLPLAPLTAEEDAQVRLAAETSPRSIEFRERRRAASLQQLAFQET